MRTDPLSPAIGVVGVGFGFTTGAEVVGDAHGVVQLGLDEVLVAVRVTARHAVAVLDDLVGEQYGVQAVDGQVGVDVTRRCGADGFAGDAAHGMQAGQAWKDY